MANVMFKRGTQAALKALNGVYTDGCFYLTTDTDRLYVAQSANELVELNKSITILNNASGLPSSTADIKGQNGKELNGSEVEVGQFYYIKAGANSVSGNILAVCDEIAQNGAIHWTQVNPDTDTNTNDNTRVTSISATKNTTSSNGQSLVYDIVIGQSTSHVTGANTSETDVSGQLTISAADVTTIVTNTAVDVDAGTVTNNKTTIATSGSGASGDGFTLEGSNTVTLTNTTGGIKIDAADTHYNLASPAVSGATAAASSVINLGIVNGSETGGGSITVKAGEDLAINNGVSASATPGASGKIKVPNITIDAQGHVTAAADQEITLPGDNNTYVGSVTAGNDGKFSITHTGTASNTVTSGAVLFHKITVDGTENTVNNQNSLGSFYSAAKVDELVQGLNAMTYKGTVFGTGATVNALPTTGVSIGDTYLATGDSGNYTSGDLIVAVAKPGASEGSDGTLAANDLDWVRVPAGRDADTTYTFSVAGNQVKYHTSVNATDVTLVEIAGGTDLTASTSGNVITINHDAVNASDTGPSNTPTALAAGDNVDLVTAITRNSTGHVTGVTTTKYQLPADNNTTYTMAVAANTPAITLTPSAGTTNTVTFNAGTAMGVTAPSANNITISHANVSRSADSTASGGALSASGSLSVVTGVTSNEQGHITGVTTTEYTLPPDNNTTYTIGVTENVNQINLIPSTGTTTSITISSNSLAVSAGTNQLSINLEWGTF